MHFEGEAFKKEFEEAFGFPISEVTERQAWFLTKFAKHCRLRCRNNSAFNNYMNRNFPGLHFGQETKQNTFTDKEYEGLVIRKK